LAGSRAKAHVPGALGVGILPNAHQTVVCPAVVIRAHQQFRRRARQQCGSLVTGAIAAKEDQHILGILKRPASRCQAERQGANILAGEEHPQRLNLIPISVADGMSRKFIQACPARVDRKDRRPMFGSLFQLQPPDGSLFVQVRGDHHHQAALAQAGKVSPRSCTHLGGQVAARHAGIQQGGTVQRLG